MKRFISKKTVAIGLTAGLILGAGGAAFVYFTSTGSGIGSASVGASASLDISQDLPAPSGLVPNGTPQTINYTVTNNTSAAEFVGQVTTTVSGVTTGALASEPCSVSMFKIVDELPLNTNLQPGDTKSGTATIQLQDDNNNQDNCQNATVSLAFVSN